jgi:hypothetical protein
MEQRGERRIARDDLLVLAAYAGLNVEHAGDLDAVSNHLAQLLADVCEWRHEGLGVTQIADGGDFVRPVTIDRVRSGTPPAGDT